MTIVIHTEHPEDGSTIIIAVMSLQTGELYYCVETIIGALEYADREKAIGQQWISSIQLQVQGRYIVAISAADVRRLINHSDDPMAQTFSDWLLEDIPGMAMNQAEQMSRQ